MGEVPGLPSEALEVPGRIAVRPEETAAHVVVDAIDHPPARLEECDGFRPDQATAPGDQYPLSHAAPRSCIAERNTAADGRLAGARASRLGAVFTLGGGSTDLASCCCRGAG